MIHLWIKQNHNQSSLIFCFSKVYLGLDLPPSESELIRSRELECGVRDWLGIYFNKIFWILGLIHNAILTVFYAMNVLSESLLKAFQDLFHSPLAWTGHEVEHFK